MAWIRTITTTSNWQKFLIDIDDSRHDEYFALQNREGYFEKFQQGIDQGWIIQIQEVLPRIGE
jgi:hypothetical protein